MPGRGEWTVRGSGAELHVLSKELRKTGQSGLKKNITKAMRVATVPARDAVRSYLRDEMPKGGGLNEWLAKSRITTSILTGPKTAGVVIRDSKSGHDLKAINRTGKVRHPTRSGPGFKTEDRKKWRLTDTGKTNWWEETLYSFDPAVRAALIVAMYETAREAGFRG